MYLDDPWTLPSLNTLDEDDRPTRMEMSFSVVETAYQVTLDPSVDSGPSSSCTEEEDLLTLPTWIVASSCLYDYLNGIFPSIRAVSHRIGQRFIG